MTSYSPSTGIYENVWITGMTSLRQTSNMTTHMTSSSNHHHLNNSHDDNNLDLLLEDLQTSVSRPGSSVGHNGPLASGYREVTRTVTTQGVNGPTNSTEYQIEYLNPANPTTVIAERATSPNFDILHSSTELPPGSRKVAQYKAVQSYQYKTVGGTPVYQDGSSGSIKQNMTELDSLLDDLNTAQKTGFSSENNLLVKKSSGIDSGLIDPIEPSIPKGGHVSRSVEKKVFQEQRYGSVGRQSPAREIKHEKIVQETSPLRQRKEMYRYETKTTRSGNNVREVSPPSPPPIRSAPSPSRHQQQQIRSYNYTSSADQDIPRTPTMRRSTSPSHRSPSPAGKSTVRSYNYSTNRHEYSTDGGSYSHNVQPPYRSPSPTSRSHHASRTHTYNTTTGSQDHHRAPYRSPSPGPKQTTVHSYNYSTTSTSSKESRQDIPRTPPPHRSPSPVSFTQPPMPNAKVPTKPYGFEGAPKPQSPQPIQKFSPSDPSKTLNYQVSPQQPTVITYKYSSHSTQSTKYPGEEHVPLLPRPFPTSPSPTPEQQQPPKKLDELMASFSDSEIQQQHLQQHDVPSRYTHQPPQQHQPPKPPASPVVESTIINSSHSNIDHQKSKNVAGPPVYYPPGVELFSKKEEVMQQSGGGGKMKSKAKASYEYESKSKSKVKESSGKAVVPVCLPVCCAMPCVIM